MGSCVEVLELEGMVEELVSTSETLWRMLDR